MAFAKPSPQVSPSPSPSASTSASPAPQQPPQDGLVAYYAFEGNANSQDHLHDGKLGSSMTFFDMGIKGQAAHFVASPINEVGVFLKNSAEIQLGKAFSISVWSKAFWGDKYSEPLLCTTDADIERFGLFWSPGGADVYLNKASSNELWLHREKAPRPQFQAFEWHHTVASYDGQQLRVYLDGKRDLTIDYVSSSSQEHGKFQEIGLCPDVLADPDLNLFAHYEGYLDELRIYSRVLTDAEVQALYQFDKGDSP